MRPRLVGLLLFLPVPLVLFLFTRSPLGPLASLGIGVLIMLTHRLYARPWALSHSAARCLWCGADAAPSSPSSPGGGELAIEDPLGRAAWRACGERHAALVRSVVVWAARHRRFLAVGILGTLAVFLAWGAVSGFGWPRPLAFDDAVSFFRLGVALTVLPLGWLAARAEPQVPAATLRPPFPIHVAALVGLRSVLWLFRLVGLLWLVQGSLRVAGRLGMLG